MLQKTLEAKIQLTKISDPIDNTKRVHSHKSLPTNFSNNIMNTETNNSINKQKKNLVYKRNIIKNKNQNSIIKRNKETFKISNLPKTQRGIIHSSSSGNLKSNLNTNNNINQNYKKEDTFINIEDLLLLEDKFCDVIYALNNKSSNLSNNFFELLNFYNNSSLYNKFENYYKNPDYKKAVHKVILLLMYNIILCYNISFDRNFLIKLLNIFQLNMNKI